MRFSPIDHISMQGAVNVTFRKSKIGGQPDDRDRCDFRRVSFDFCSNW
jgi:hypothetical protein